MGDHGSELHVRGNLLQFVCKLDKNRHGDLKQQIRKIVTDISKLEATLN